MLATSPCLTQDLSEYLQQFLGKTERELQPFIEDVLRVQQGHQPLSILRQQSDADEKRSHKPPTTPALEPTASKTKAIHQKKSPPRQKQPKRATKAKAPGKQPTSAVKPLKPTPTQQPPTTPLEVKEPPEAVYPETSTTREKSTFIRGTPAIICGCFGNLHKPLHNCLHCGRISCEREGYDFCAFCGYMVTPPGGYVCMVFVLMLSHELTFTIAKLAALPSNTKTSCSSTIERRHSVRSSLTITLTTITAIPTGLQMKNEL